jgi:hypothetical protein
MEATIADLKAGKALPADTNWTALALAVSAQSK